MLERSANFRDLRPVDVSLRYKRIHELSSEISEKVNGVLMDNVIGSYVLACK